MNSVFDDDDDMTYLEFFARMVLDGRNGGRDGHLAWCFSRDQGPRSALLDVAKRT